MPAATTRRLLVGVFGREADLLAATREFRARGHELVDAYTPFAVHGLDAAMGLTPSRLPWVCFGFGLLGALGKVWFEYWTTAVDWPVNVGGKPFNSLPAFVPITFEVMVLFAGLASVAALLIAARLYPGRKPVMPTDRVTDSHFVLVVAAHDASFVWDEARALCERHHSLEVREQLEERG